MAKPFDTIHVATWQERLGSGFGDAPKIQAMLQEIEELRAAKHSLEVSLAEAKDDFNEITSALEKQSLVWDDELFMYVTKPR